MPTQQQGDRAGRQGVESELEGADVGLDEMVGPDATYAGFADALEMIVGAADGVVDDEGLGPGAGAHGGPDHAPLVERLGNEGDAVAVLHDLEFQIHILHGAIFRLFAHRAGGLENGPGIEAKVDDVVRGEVELRAPGRLERQAEGMAVLVDEDVIGIDHVAVASVLEQGRAFVERMGEELVVVVDEPDELAAAQCQGTVCSAGDVQVALVAYDLDARVAPGVVLEQGLNVRLGRGVVYDAQLPVRIYLRADRLDRLGEILAWGIVYGHDHGHERSKGKALHAVAHCPHGAGRGRPGRQPGFLARERRNGTRKASKQGVQSRNPGQDSGRIGGEMLRQPAHGNGLWR